MGWTFHLIAFGIIATNCRCLILCNYAACELYVYKVGMLRIHRMGMNGGSIVTPILFANGALNRIDDHPLTVGVLR
jgi:hypothetical protein